MLKKIGHEIELQIVQTMVDADFFEYTFKCNQQATTMGGANEAVIIDPQLLC